jgi:hypothetical protein
VTRRKVIEGDVLRGLPWPEPPAEGQARVTVIFEDGERLDMYSPECQARLSQLCGPVEPISLEGWDVEYQ